MEKLYDLSIRIKIFITVQILQFAILRLILSIRVKRKISRPAKRFILRIFPIIRYHIMNSIRILRVYKRYFARRKFKQNLKTQCGEINWNSSRLAKARKSHSTGN